MDKHNLSKVGHLVGVCAAALALGACERSGGSNVGVSKQALVAQCATSASPAPSGAWICPATQTVECTGGTGTVDVDFVYVQDGAQAQCDGATLSVSNAGPFAVGSYSIDVSSDDDDAGTLCTAQLEVVDTQAPVLTEHTLDLWPPNHKLHAISPSDCVSALDACSGELQGEFIWASSDEPIDSIGDGQTVADIGFVDAHNACVRSERQGPKDGRVYKLGVRFSDAAGHVAEGACTIIVDHDQRGVVGHDSGEAYRVDFASAPHVDPCGGGGEGEAGSGAADGGSAGAGAGGTGTSGTGSAGDGAPIDAGGPVITPVVDGGTPF